MKKFIKYAPHWPYSGMDSISSKWKSILKRTAKLTIGVRNQPKTTCEQNVLVCKKVAAMDNANVTKNACAIHSHVTAKYTELL